MTLKRDKQNKLEEEKRAESKTTTIKTKGIQIIKLAKLVPHIIHNIITCTTTVMKYSEIIDGKKEHRIFLYIIKEPSYYPQYLHICYNGFKKSLIAVKSNKVRDLSES